jgi:hypothetical protein
LGANFTTDNQAHREHKKNIVVYHRIYALMGRRCCWLVSGKFRLGKRDMAVGWTFAVEQLLQTGNRFCAALKRRQSVQGFVAHTTANRLRLAEWVHSGCGWYKNLKCVWRRKLVAHENGHYVQGLGSQGVLALTVQLWASFNTILSPHFAFRTSGSVTASHEESHRFKNW